MVRVRVEFTIEPFVDGLPGPHVDAALAAVRGMGLDVEIGPFGTTIEGPVAAMAGAVHALLIDAVSAGASRVSIQATTVTG